jgi:hypothetical protein
MIQATQTDFVGMMTYSELLRLYRRAGWEMATRQETYLYLAGGMIAIFLIAFLVDTYNRT